MLKTTQQRLKRRTAIAALLLLLAAGACSSGSKPVNASAPNGSGTATKSPIVIGYVGEQTGALSSTFGDGPVAAQARVDLQNASGGIDGHPLKLVIEDDATTPSQNLTAAQGVVAKGAIGVVEIGAFPFSAAPYLKEQGLPVTGAGLDGPEWAEPTYPNMFEFDPPAVLNGQEYVSTASTVFFKEAGVTRLALLSNAGSPSSAVMTAADAKAAEGAGIAVCYNNPSVPITLANFTAIVLQIKQSRCNGVQMLSGDAQSLALTQALKDSGLNLVAHADPATPGDIVAFTSTGYDQSIVGNPANSQTFQGAFSYAQPVPFSPPNAAVQKMLAALSTYQHYQGTVPDLGIEDAWIATDMLITGLEASSPSFGKAAIIQGLRQMRGYSAGGVLPYQIDFATADTVQGLQSPPCTYFEQLQGAGYVLYGGKPVCGANVIAGPVS